MKINTIRFLISNTAVEKCPVADKPEYAFIGRSNVGKSSLINMLGQNSKLAKISGKPGKTQTINHFIVNESWYLVDLPGYGYAKTAKTNRKQWAGFTNEYIIKRPNLMALFVLIDSRIPPQQSDLEFLYQAGSRQVPFVLVFTKTDKLKANEKNQRLQAFQQAFLEYFEYMPEYFFTSATNGSGREELLDFIARVNLTYTKIS